MGGPQVWHSRTHGPRTRAEHAPVPPAGSFVRPLLGRPLQQAVRAKTLSLQSAAQSRKSMQQVVDLSKTSTHSRVRRRLPLQWQQLHLAQGCAGQTHAVQAGHVNRGLRRGCMSAAANCMGQSRKPCVRSIGRQSGRRVQESPRGRAPP